MKPAVKTPGKAPKVVAAPVAAKAKSPARGGKRAAPGRSVTTDFADLDPQRLLNEAISQEVTRLVTVKGLTKDIAVEAVRLKLRNLLTVDSQVSRSTPIGPQDIRVSTAELPSLPSRAGRKVIGKRGRAAAPAKKAEAVPVSGLLGNQEILEALKKKVLPIQVIALRAKKSVADIRRIGREAGILRGPGRPPKATKPAPAAKAPARPGRHAKKIAAKRVITRAPKLAAKLVAKPAVKPAVKSVARRVIKRAKVVRAPAKAKRVAKPVATSNQSAEAVAWMKKVNVLKNEHGLGASQVALVLKMKLPAFKAKLAQFKKLANTAK